MNREPAIAFLCGSLVVYSTLIGCGERGQDTVKTNAPERQSSAAHQRMVRTLAALHDERHGDHPYYGDLHLRSVELVIAGIDPVREPAKHLSESIRLAEANVEYGNIRLGIEQLTEIYDRLAAQGSRSPLTWRTTLALGIAYLRLAETENCCNRYAPESCILPLAGGALHSETEGSEAAARFFLETYRLTAGNEEISLLARWLFNLAHMTLGTYPQGVPADLRIPDSLLGTEIDFPRFRNIASEAGVATDSLSGGAIADDFDGDGDFDLLVGSWESGQPLRYFENTGVGGFVDQTERSGLRGIDGGLNMIQGDYDNDGDPDVLVMRGGWLAHGGDIPNSLLRNDGAGWFEDVTYTAGLAEVHYPTQAAAWFDFDNDGDLDIYIGNEEWQGMRAPCQLFRNEGDGTFVDVAERAGVTGGGIVKAVVCGDLDNDRWEDIVVSVSGGANYLYRNNRDGTFSEVAAEAGVERPINSFPAWIWDYNNDGNLDLFISSFTGLGYEFVLPALGRKYFGEVTGHYRGDGTGRFEDRGELEGLALPMLTMGCNFGDLDNDGWLDLYLGTGAPELRSVTPNRLFSNRAGDGFVEVTMASGLGHLQKGHAVAFADFDGDGDQDIFEQMGGAMRVDRFRDALYQNPGFGKNWIGIKLVGVESNRSAIGARIHVEFLDSGARRSVHRHVCSGGSFGGNPLQQHIGLGEAAEGVKVSVFWPKTGRTQTFEDLAANRAYVIVEDASQARPSPRTRR